MQLPPPLPADILATSERLPLKPDPVTLRGSTVYLLPTVIERDCAILYALSNGDPIEQAGRHYSAYDPDEQIWRWMFAGPFDSLASFQGYLQDKHDSSNTLSFTVFNAQNDQPLGMACYLNNTPSHLKIELGSIWYSPIAQGTGANTAASALMIDHAVRLGYQRIEWKCNALNDRSRRAALRIGFTFEGIQESHLIIKGRSRDTAWFRILAREWPALRENYQPLLDIKA
jgi:RimJ/RimL family protein N-acetyltransferase